MTKDTANIILNALSALVAAQETVLRETDLECSADSEMFAGVRAHLSRQFVPMPLFLTLAQIASE